MQCGGVDGLLRALRRSGGPVWEYHDNMHDYDTTLKLLLRGSAQLTWQALVGAAEGQWLNIELPEVRALRLDLLFETLERLLIQIELQTTNDPKMALRMAEYYLAIYRLFGRFPRQIVLYVGDGPLSMQSELRGANHWFRYELVDIRELDGEKLLESTSIGDNMIAILGHLPDHRDAARRILERIAGLAPEERRDAVVQFGILSGLRKLGGFVKKEIKKMPLLEDLMNHDLLGPVLRKGLKQGRQEGELAILRRQIESRFGPMPDWAQENLSKRSTAELEELGVRLLDARTLKQLLRR